MRLGESGGRVAGGGQGRGVGGSTLTQGLIKKVAVRLSGFSLDCWPANPPRNPGFCCSPPRGKNFRRRDVRLSSFSFDWWPANPPRNPGFVVVLQEEKTFGAGMSAFPVFHLRVALLRRKFFLLGPAQLCCAPSHGSAFCRVSRGRRLFVFLQGLIKKVAVRLSGF